MALDFVAGCLGGCAGIMVGYPLDTVKVHMQTQDHRNPKYRGTWHCLRTIFMKESLTGLYRGMSSPMAGVAAVNAIVFGVYGQTERHLKDPDSLSAHFLAGAYAGIAQTPISSPIELAKTRMQLQSSGQCNFSGPMQCLRHIYKQQGYRGVFKGLGITFLREAPSYGTYFLVYEYLTRTSSSEPISTARMLLAGGLAGTASWVISYPLDVVKSRLQAETTNIYTGALDCLKKSVKAEGYACLYKGLGSTILRAFPTNAATFTVVSWTFRIFGQENGGSPKVEREATLIKPIKRISNEYEPFLNKWNIFLEGVAREQMFTRSYHSASAVLLRNGLVLENSDTYPIDRTTKELPIRYGALEQTRALECREKRKDELKGDQVPGDGSADESSTRKKVEIPACKQTAEDAVALRYA